MLLQWLLAAEKHVELAAMRGGPQPEDMDHISAALTGARRELARLLRQIEHG
jgi:hypothetical protein